MSRSIFTVVLVLLAVTVRAQGDQPVSLPNAAPSTSFSDRNADVFFESRVRPILVNHCLGCHGPHKQRGGLRLDSAEGMRKGSDNGPVVLLAAPEKSPLLQAIRHDDAVKMPPKGKLPAQGIEALTLWIKMGAPWPVPAAAGKATGERHSEQVGKQHWAFQPLRPPAIPRVKDATWGSSPIDAFILARLESRGLTPGKPADRRTLLRRATFDLHGLPPTPEAVAQFEADATPDAYAKVIDGLLASPRYGERWGRHWLDVARYADTKGYVRLQENPRYPCSWTYRDYVIRALNADLPYDQFLLQQLAADKLPRGDDRRSLAALGFLTLGQRFLNSLPDIIDDRMDVVGRGLMGLTITCARCHDHKFDPIPTRDYYSLYGVFASSVEPRIPPMIALPSEQGKYLDYQKELRARQEKFSDFLRGQHARLTKAFRARAGDYLLAAQKEEVQANFVAVMFLVDSAKDLNPVAIQRWSRFLEQTRKVHHPVLTPWNTLARLAPGTFASKVPEVLAALGSAADGKPRVNPIVTRALHDRPPQNLGEAAARYGELFQAADQRWQQTLQKNSAAQHLDDPNWEELRRLLYGPDAPADVPFAELEDYFFVDTTAQNKFHEQQRLVLDWIGSPNAAPHALILEDAPVPYTPHVFLRGNSSNPGEVVPRQFLKVLSPGVQRPFQQGSGRLELAHAIASKDNPLTARVLVNRVWLHHFGAGIVRTPSDFGLRGEPPTHPELLDYLAGQFMEDGWSLKRLHRHIMLSSVYQQQSKDNSRCREKDPENTLLWKMNRRRLDWEALRDALLAVSGRLDETRGGPSVDLTVQPFSTRRTVYGFIDRQNWPGVFRTFDFDAPETSTAQRHQTTVPQQALFLMNSPFLRECSRNLAVRQDLTSDDTEQRIRQVYRLLYGRAAEPEEIAAGKNYLSAARPAAGATRALERSMLLTPWEEYVQALLLTNEFAFID